MDSSADFKWSLLRARRALQHRQAEPRRDPNRGTRPGREGVSGSATRDRSGQFRGHQRAETMAISGQKPWPSVGSFVAAYGQFFMAADKWSGLGQDQGSCTEGGVAELGRPKFQASAVVFHT